MKETCDVILAPEECRETNKKQGDEQEMRATSRSPLPPPPPTPPATAHICISKLNVWPPLQSLRECVQFKRSVALSWTDFFSYFLLPTPGLTRSVYWLAKSWKNRVRFPARQIEVCRRVNVDRLHRSTAEVELFLHFSVRLHGVILLYFKYNWLRLHNYGNLFWQRFGTLISYR
jgi:hypothetical protein